MKTPTPSAISGVIVSFASSTANCDAARAYWMKTSIFLTSFLSTNCSGSNALTSPAIRAECCDASKRVMGPIPLRPAQSASQFACVPMASGDTSPTPDTTTRLLNPPPSGSGCSRTLRLAAVVSAAKGGRYRGGLFLGLRVRLDVLDRFLHARDLLGVLVRNFDPELLLEGHHELDGVERVGAQVIDERGIRRHFLFVDPELLHDDALHLVCYGHSALHMAGSREPASNSIARSGLAGSEDPAYMYMPPLTARTCPVIYDASSEARKHTAAAISSGVPSRFRGILAVQSPRTLSVIARVMSVSISPGATEFTVIVRDATSCATDFTKPMSPAFEAA